MDITTGLMLVMVALTEGVETPLGHVKSFDTPDGGEPDEETQNMIDSIATYVEVMEASEKDIDWPTKNDIYVALRKEAARDMPIQGQVNNGEQTKQQNVRAQNV